MNKIGSFWRLFLFNYQTIIRYNQLETGRWLGKLVAMFKGFTIRFVKE